MNEFEKDFPSLKDFISDKGKEYESVFSNHIQKHCLDKKKVLEVVNEHLEGFGMPETLKIIKKELNLE